MRRCTCRRCNPTPFDGLASVLRASFTRDDLVRHAADRYVTSVPTWGYSGMAVESLEAELDEILGLTHARWETERARHELERLRRRAGRHGLREVIGL